MRTGKMKISTKISDCFRSFSRSLSLSRSICVFLAFSSLFFAACNELKKPQITPFYAETAPPQKKEFRWSNGKMPKSFDPARAGAPPETDVVRAIFEGLTETDPITLKPIPAIAAEWNSSKDFKTWTFKLRRDAKWSNGKNVTAKDFVSSWRRLGKLGAQAAHRDLLQNIVGMPFEKSAVESSTVAADNEIDLSRIAEPRSPLLPNQSVVATPPVLLPTPDIKTAENQSNQPKIQNAPPAPEKIGEKKNESKIAASLDVKFGVEALGEHALKVSLIAPDKDFPSLVAHPIFRPVYDGGASLEADKLDAGIVTNGAFRIVSVGQDGVTLDRSENYWNKSEIQLERVRFVPAENAEKALSAYRAGEVDAVTNVEFEPLALKLLTPYDDFRRTTHSAVNFYEFNSKKAPFDDHRVREALAISIDRERLTEGDTEGATEPAFGFLPIIGEKLSKLTQNTEKAKQLLTESGYANGENFPTVKLIINRNDLQRKIARSVARMWKQSLNIETEIVVKDAAEIEAIRENGDFDLVRRGVVLPTANETANMLKIFEPQKKLVKQPETETGESAENSSQSAAEDDSKTNETEKRAELKAADKVALIETLEPNNGILILTEDAAIAELPAIPLYFSTSYSLVKPYISGFENNTLDAPSLKDVRIDIGWQPKKEKSES